MLKCLVLLTLTIITFMQTLPAYCGVSRTETFQISVTIPPHVMANDALNVIPVSNNAFQLVQTQIVIRNNKTISLTSIVVP